jgi:hypothetical protein
MRARDLLHHRAEALSLLKRVFHDLLQVNAVACALRKPVAVLFDLAHVEQKRGQRSVELTRDRGSRFIHRAAARSGQPDDLEIVVGRRVALQPLRKVRIAGFLL